MKKRMESDLLLKIISVVFAFLLWMFVINTDNPVIKKILIRLIRLNLEIP